MKMNFLRRLALLCAVLTCGMLLALPAAAAEADAPYAEDGDMDYIRSYVVTVDPREDGSADITYDIDWQVIDGDKTDYLSWVKIGLANSSVDELTPLTDTISDLQYTSDGGSYAKVVFRHRYYAPDVAAANGGESSVHFAFSVHQSHLFTKNDDGTANFAFTPGWFDDLSVENMQVRWHNYDGFVADNTGVDGDYLTWDFGVMGHGQQAMVHVTVPVTNAAAFDPGAAMTTDDYDSGEDLDEIIGVLATVIVILLAIAVIIIAIASQSPEWGGGFGSGIDPDDWFWYTNGVHTIRCARSAPPPSGYHRTDPPPEFRAGGQLVHHALQRIVAARAVWAAEQHHAAGVGGVVRRAQHKRAAERLDQRRDKGILPQHLGLDLFGHSGKIRLGGRSRGRGGRSDGAAQQTVLLERLRQLAAHPAHALRRGGPCLLHGVQCAARGSLALLGLGQGVQLGLHLLHGVAGVLSLLRGRGVPAAAHQAADPGIVLVFQAHRLSSVSGLMQASAPTDFLGSFTV